MKAHWCGIKGYSLRENVQVRGSKTGVPHLGTRAWPEINKSVFSIGCEDIDIIEFPVNYKY